jgi:hypothetical protein
MEANMATYCVTRLKGSDWDESAERFKTRPEADHRLAEIQATGQFARLVMWDNHKPKEMARVNDIDRAS